MSEHPKGKEPIVPGPQSVNHRPVIPSAAEDLPEGLTVFERPESHRKRMRTTSMLERLHEEINRRTRLARLFPNEASLLRLVSAVEMEIREDWIAGKRYVTMNAENENDDKNANSTKKRIYRKDVA